MARAWNSAMEHEFADRAGQILADAIEDGTAQHDYIERLAEAYTDCVGDLPEPTNYEEEE